MPAFLNRWLNRAFSRPSRQVWETKADSICIIQSWGNKYVVKLAWDEIDSVFAYKKDCFTEDQIRLVIGNSTSQTWIEVTEDDLEYKILLTELEQRLVGFPSSEHWFSRVAFPAFETNWTVLYQRTPSELSPAPTA